MSRDGGPQAPAGKAGRATRRVSRWVIMLMTAAPVGLTGQAPTLTEQTAGTTELLQAVSVVDSHVVWISGHGGTYVRTEDGGRRWMAGRVPGADTLQFRDVHAVDRRTAYLLSAGIGDLSRIYKTTDGGETWDLLFRNTEPAAFYDCFDFWDARRGLAYSDAVDGRLVILRTNDGRTWSRLPPDRVPAAMGSEGGFAASGTCLVTRDARLAWIGTGAGDTARVVRTTDAGRTWIAEPVPIVSGGGVSGIFTVAFRDALHGVALGGDLQRADEYTQNVIATTDGGASWHVAGRPSFPGAVYGAAYVREATPPILVAVGPKGAAFSEDDGMTWQSLAEGAYWATGFAESGTGWLVGPNGGITHVRFGGRS